MLETSIQAPLGWWELCFAISNKLSSVFSSLLIVRVLWLKDSCLISKHLNIYSNFAIYFEAIYRPRETKLLCSYPPKGAWKEVAEETHKFRCFISTFFGKGLVLYTEFSMKTKPNIMRKIKEVILDLPL